MSENPLHEADILVKSAEEMNLRQNHEVTTSGQCTQANSHLRKVCCHEVKYISPVQKVAEIVHVSLLVK